jgi:nucleotidyltransferase substrate binding protein (TIGR01987 family)
MAELKKRKLKEAVKDLERCIKLYQPSTASERSIYFIALTKAFEVTLEYGWKELKKILEDKGLEAYSPKDVVKEAAQIKLLDNPKLWIDCINVRNLSVHDYFTVPEEGIVTLAKSFLSSVKKVFSIK